MLSYMRAQFRHLPHDATSAVLWQQADWTLNLLKMKVDGRKDNVYPIILSEWKPIEKYEAGYEPR